MLNSYFKAAGLIAAVVALSVSAAAANEHWPQWRGPEHNGISTVKNIPAEWSKDGNKNVAWRLELPGRSGATPAIWGKHIFVPTANDAGELLLLAVDTDGKKLWEKKIGDNDRPGRGDEGNMASVSPVTDGKHVWIVLGNGPVACFDFEGNEVWKFNLHERFGKFQLQFGYHSSPVLWKDHLLLQMIHGGRRSKTEEAMVAALDKSTGKTVWKKDRHSGAYDENKHSYTSPVLCDLGDRQLFVTHGADYAIAYDPKTGDEVWRMGGLNPHDDPDRRYHRTLRFVASPAVSKDLIVLPTAKNQQVFAIRPDLKGDLTNNKEALVWKLPRYTPDVPTPLIHDGLVYICNERGTLMCLEAATGKTVYQQRLHYSRYRASPTLADGKIFLTSRDGVVTVVKTGKEFEKLSEVKMGEEIESSPAFADETMYIRTFDALWAIRNK